MRKKDSRKDINNALILVLQVGISMIVPILMCTLFGVFLSKRLDMPMISLGAIIIGCIAGFNGVYRLLKGYLKDTKSPGQIARERDEEKKSHEGTEQ